MHPLTLTMCQAPNAEPTCRAIAHTLGQRLGQPVRFVDDIPWPERLAGLESGEIDIGWVCGAYYVDWADRPDPTIELLAAPVMLGDRYADRPVYFSDVVVAAASPYRRFDDLRRARWAFNEPGSHSGHGVVRYHLATVGETWDYFACALASGAHQRSLQMILAGEIDASAIDSTVLETELRRNPDLADRIRVIDVLGPSAIPPWVIQRRLPANLRRQICDVFVTMHQDPDGRTLLAEGQMSHFAVVTDQDYDSIRRMRALADAVEGR